MLLWSTLEGLFQRGLPDEYDFMTSSWRTPKDLDLVVALVTTWIYSAWFVVRDGPCQSSAAALQPWLAFFARGGSGDLRANSRNPAGGTGRIGWDGWVFSLSWYLQMQEDGFIVLSAKSDGAISVVVVEVTEGLGVFIRRRRHQILFFEWNEWKQDEDIHNEICKEN